MITLTPEEIRQVQAIQLEMLEEVDRICTLRGIRYNIIAGTLLGAVRHKGYIPWDDDADVALLRPEYEKFRAACAAELDRTRFIFQDHRNTKGYRWGYGKLRRKGTLFLREYQEHMPYDQGIFIDVFPLDHVPDNYLLRSWHNFHCFCIRKVLWAKVGQYADKNRAMRLVYGLLQKIPEEWVLAHYDRFIAQSNAKKSAWVRILLFPTPNDAWGYRRRWYEESMDFVFEGKTFPGIREYDEYLRFKFGDYMTLPPVNERKGHAVTGLGLLRETGLGDG